jgi:hypothetical protein
MSAFQQRNGALNPRRPLRMAGRRILNAMRIVKDFQFHKVTKTRGRFNSRVDSDRSGSAMADPNHHLPGAKLLTDASLTCNMRFFGD